jgi:hypothetical protein
MATSDFAGFNVKWSLIIPGDRADLAPAITTKKKFLQEDLGGPGSPFSPSGTSIEGDGDSFKTKLFLYPSWALDSKWSEQSLIFDVNGSITDKAGNDNLEFCADGTVNFVQTVVYGVGRIIVAPIVFYVITYLFCYAVTWGIVRGSALGSGIANFIIAHSISPASVAGNIAKIIAWLWFLYELITLGGQLCSTRRLSKKAAEIIEAWLGKREQVMRSLWNE